MICSSVNRLRFIVRLPQADGLYSNLEEFYGLRSKPMRHAHYPFQFPQLSILSSIPS